MNIGFIDKNKKNVELMDVYFGDTIKSYNECSDCFMKSDVMIISCGIPDASGLSLARNIKSKHPEKIIYLMSKNKINCEFPFLSKGDASQLTSTICGFGAKPILATL